MAVIGCCAREIAARIHNQRERWALEREMTDLGSREVKRELTDLGASRADIPTLLEGHPHVQELQPKMLERAGVDIEEASRVPGRLRDIQRICGTCPNPNRCRRWLESEGSKDDFHAFCPNAAALDKLPRKGNARDKGSARPRQTSRNGSVSSLSSAMVGRGE
jgi:uncharacterized protein YjiS (DUF1127 family)